MSDTYVSPPPAPMGHNNPPEPMTPEEVRAHLERNNTRIYTRKDELLGSVERFKNLPPITDDEQQGRADTLSKQIHVLIKMVADVHKAQKEPFLLAGREVDGWKNGLTNALETARKVVTDRMLTYSQQVERERREKAQREAAAREAAARQAAEEAAATGTAEAFDSAIDIQRRADEAAKVAAAPSNELTRVRSDMGTTSSMVTRWGEDIVVFDPAQVPREYLTVDMDKVRSEARRLKEAFSVPGITSKPVQKMR